MLYCKKGRALLLVKNLLAIKEVFSEQRSARVAENTVILSISKLTLPTVWLHSKKRKRSADYEMRSS